MIVSHEHRFVFSHNPKAAGSAIRMSLGGLHDDPVSFWHQGFLTQLDRVVDMAHITYHDLKLVLSQDISTYEFLVVVRNPYLRFLSAWSEHRRQHGVDYQTIDEWMENHMDETNFRHNWQYIHLCPQHYFVPIFADEIDRVNVIRHERMSVEWPCFVERQSQKVRSLIKPLPLIRVRPDADVLDMSMLTPFAIGEINRVYHRDFSRFGYPMIGEPNNATGHYERVNGIHSTYFPLPRESDLTAGERIAYNQKTGTP